MELLRHLFILNRSQKLIQIRKVQIHNIKRQLTLLDRYATFLYYVVK